MTTDELTIMFTVATAGAACLNVYIGLRLAALQSKMKADSAALEVAILKQFVDWKDEVMVALNGKYVSAALISEIRTNVGQEIGRLHQRIDHIETRCEQRAGSCAPRK